MILCGGTIPGDLFNTFIATSKTIPLAVSISASSTAAVNVKKLSRVTCNIEARSQCDLQLRSRKNMRVNIIAQSSCDVNVKALRKMSVNIEAQSDAQMAVRRRLNVDFIQTRFEGD